jgi:hypothetical protein
MRRPSTNGNAWRSCFRRRRSASRRPIMPGGMPRWPCTGAGGRSRRDGPADLLELCPVFTGPPGPSPPVVDGSQCCHRERADCLSTSLCFSAWYCPYAGEPPAPVVFRALTSNWARKWAISPQIARAKVTNGNPCSAQEAK